MRGGEAFTYSLQMSAQPSTSRFVHVKIKVAQPFQLPPHGSRDKFLPYIHSNYASLVAIGATAKFPFARNRTAIGRLLAKQVVSRCCQISSVVSSPTCKKGSLELQREVVHGPCGRISSDKSLEISS